MNLIYITGISGAGKSTVQQELQRRGYTAYDADEHDITLWYNIKTGQRTDEPDETTKNTSKWVRDHEWRMSEARLREIAQEHPDEPVFICGTSSNRHSLFHLFKKIFCLTLDQETLKHRLATRDTNNFGKSEAQLNNILNWHEVSVEEDKKSGAILVDATKPLNEVVEEILRLTQ